MLPETVRHRLPALRTNRTKIPPANPLDACAGSIGSRLYPRPMPLSRAAGATQRRGRMVRANACCTNIGRLDSPRFLFSAGSQGVKIRNACFRSGGRSRGRAVRASNHIAGGARTAAAVRYDWRAPSASRRASSRALADSNAFRHAGISLRLQWAGFRDFVDRTGAGREPSHRAATSAHVLHAVLDSRQCRIAVHCSAGIVD